LMSLFKEGGGNEVAKLTRNNSLLQVNLKNTDRRSEERLIIYHFSGVISKLESGFYSFEILDSTGRLIADEKFIIP